MHPSVVRHRDTREVSELARWSAGAWTNPPAAVRLEGDALVVTAERGTDAWRLTAHGYVTDDAHALLAPLSAGTAVEVSFVAELTEQR